MIGIVVRFGKVLHKASACVELKELAFALKPWQPYCLAQGLVYGLMLRFWHLLNKWNFATLCSRTNWEANEDIRISHCPKAPGRG